MKHKRIVAFLLVMLLLTAPVSVFADSDTDFRYVHDPRLNPACMADVIVNPDAVYGFSPRPDGGRLSSYAAFDWSDEELIAASRLERIAYHESLRSLYELEAQLEAEGCSIEEIARAVSHQRNVLRLEAYADNPEGLEAAKASNIENYGNEFGPTADSLFEKYGKWETVLEKAFSTNSGMDACLGLYDDYYALYVLLGQIPDTWYADAMEWAYARDIPEPITGDVFTPEIHCTRGEAVTLLWTAAGCPTVNFAMQMEDVAPDAYYAEAVRWALAEGISKGTGETTFSPDRVCTRAEIVTLLWRAAECPDTECVMQAEDVAPDAYYAAAVRWAMAEGISMGTGKAEFSPDNDCTRAEVVTFLYRAAA